MNRPSTTEPPAGPSVIAVLLLLNTAVHGLRWFAVPVAPDAVPPGAFGLESLQRGEWWTCLTHIFMHGSLWHLGINLFLLWLAGRSVQSAAGQQNTAYIFLLGAWTGAAASFLSRPEASIIGASGGIMGLVGACSALFPEHNLLRPLRHRLNTVLRAKQLSPALLLAFLILEIAAHTGLYGASSPEAHMVHAGGLLTGWLYGRRISATGEAQVESRGFSPLRRHGNSAPIDHSLLLAGLAMLPAGRKPILQPTAAPASTVKQLSDADFLAQRVDPVLEKLFASGAGQLTDAEKAILEEAARRFPKKNEESSPP